MNGEPQFPTQLSTKNTPFKESKSIDRVKHSLTNFSKQHGVPDLSGRVKRGLDPIGILALEKTQKIVKELCKKLHASYQDVLHLTLDIQKNGPWGYASALKEASSPAIRVWMILNAVNSMGKEREMDLTSQEFLADVKRIHTLLAQAIKSENFFAQTKQHVLEYSQRQFRIQEGVPISELDNGFIAMALHGYEGGIIQDADGLLFVGVKSVDPDVFTQWGLVKKAKQDRGGRDVIFYKNEKGEELIKQLYPGYFIVLSRDFNLAKAIVKAATGRLEESDLEGGALGHKLYAPTSMGREASADKLASARKHIKPTKRIQENGSDESEKEGETLRSDFYRKLKYVKSTEIFRDKIPSFRKKKRAKKEKIAHADLEKEAQKTEEKIEQKMEELRYMMDIIRPTLKKLPNSVHTVMDMAGGAGDLGMAVTMEMLAANKPLQGTHIVEPFSELQVFNRIILNELPRAEEFKKIIIYDIETVQETTIPSDAIVVAKHACGDLTDAIIEEWVESESPLLAIMTCCQDKAKYQPARYGLSQEEWERLCRISGKTGDTNPVNRAKGMEAMTQLDEARVAFLRRHGFEAELIQTDAFPKGDVIIARRK